MASDIIFEHEGAGAVVTFNRPEVRNALNPAMIAELADFIRDIREHPTVRYLLFKGAGEHFSSGGDVASYAKMLSQSPSAVRRAFERRVRNNAEAFIALASLPMPVISLVRGSAAGAGLSVILASDFVLASDDAVLIFAQPRIGLALDLGMSYLLPRVVGLKMAKKLALTAARIDAAEARSIGILDEVHAAAEIDAALASLLKRLGDAAPRAAARSKTLLIESESRSMLEQMEAEVAALGQCCIEPDFAEGVTAFMEKRRARFEG